MVEGPWPDTAQKARMSFRGAVSLPVGPGQSPGGGAGDEVPGSSGNLAFYST